MRSSLFPLAVSAALLSPIQSYGKPEDPGNLSNYGNIATLIQTIEHSKQRFMDIIDRECSSQSRIRVTPDGFYYYPGTGFQFNIMTQKLQLCNGGVPERLGVSNMEISECGSIDNSDGYVCTLTNSQGKNELCVVANPSGSISMQTGNCRTSFPENN